MEYSLVLLWIAGGSGQTGGANTPRSLLQRLAALAGFYGEGTTESTPNSSSITGRTNAGFGQSEG